MLKNNYKLSEYWIEEAERKARARQYTEERRKLEELYKQITEGIKFTNIFVRKAQSRQTGEKTVFYDIDLQVFPKTDVKGELWKEYEKYHKLRGYSLNLSYYASYRQEMIYNTFIRCKYIPALEWVYEQYVRDHFYGKEVDYEYYYSYFCRLPNLVDWFDEVYKADNKIKTSFQEKIEEMKEI